MSPFTTVNRYMFQMLTGHPHPDVEVETGKDGVDQAAMYASWQVVAEPVIEPLTETLYSFPGIPIPN